VSPRWERVRDVALVIAAVLLLLGVLLRDARGESIPREALQYRALLTRAAHAEWGLDAPTATFAAQVHQESGWRASARSLVGARGLAQFMPATQDWWGGQRPDLGQPDAWNPGWALRGLVSYDRWIWERVRADTPCDRWAMALAGYNGGLGWVRRDQALAGRSGLDASRWWDGVELANAGRSQAAWRENRGYPRRILIVLEPVYRRAGWGAGVCPGGRL